MSWLVYDGRGSLCWCHTRPQPTARLRCSNILATGCTTSARKAHLRDSVPTENLPQILSHLGPSQHSLRLLQETSLGKTLADVGPTQVGLLPLRFSTPGAHGLAADLATGSPTGPPGIKITQSRKSNSTCRGLAGRFDALRVSCSTPKRISTL